MTASGAFSPFRAQFRVVRYPGQIDRAEAIHWQDSAGRLAIEGTI
jgi:hypothetical protein